MNENTCFKHKLFLLKLHSTYFEVNSHRKKNQPCQDDKQIAYYKEMDAQKLNSHTHHFKKFLSVKGKFNTSLTGQTGRGKKKEPTRPLSFSKYASKPNKNPLKR